MYPVPVISRARLRFSAPLLAAALTAVARLAAGEALTLATATDREYYLPGGSRQYLIETRIGTAEVPADAGGAASAPAAAPRNLAFVLDRSGSMAGEPLDAVRAGLRAVVAALGERDVLSVVFFGSEVETLAEARGRGELGDFDASLARVEAAGGAALYDALNQGAALLRRHAAPGAVGQLVLLTDGPPTKGPRERSDFTKLGELFAGEGIAFSTVGFGPDFDEDLLATLARTGAGKFLYVEVPEKLRDALPAALAPARAVVARNVVLTVESNWTTEEIEVHGALAATLGHDSATFRFPLLLAGQSLHPLTAIKSAGPMLFGAPVGQPARVRLQWTDPADGSAHELKKDVSVRFDTDVWTSRDSQNAAVARTIVDAVITDGLKDAIEQLDKGDARRALRALRRARDDAKDFNIDLNDAAIKARLAQFDAYLAAVSPRGLTAADRKVLRSGLLGVFDPPAVAQPAAR